MRGWLACIAFTCACAFSAATLIAQQPVERAVCDRLLPRAALAADVGPGFVLKSFYEPRPDHWSCQWETATEPPRVLTVEYWATGPNRVRDIFLERLGKLTRPGVPTENVRGIGSVAVLTTEGTDFQLEARTDDAIVTVIGLGLGRAQMLAVSKRLAATPPTTVAEARAALAKLQGQPVKPSEPLPPLPDVVVRREGQPLECERLLPRREVVAVLGDAYRLTDANDPRSGFSFCDWKRPTDDHPLSLRVHGGPEFALASVTGPAGFFALEVKLSPCQSQPGEPLKGIGEQAVLCSSGGQYFNVIIRRAADVLVLSCFTCTREQMIALGRSAVN